MLIEALLVVAIGVAAGLGLAAYPRLALLLLAAGCGAAIAAGAALCAPRAALDLLACFVGFVLVSIRLRPR